jgi:hypothetical protein
LAACACTANEPLIKPAIAAPARIAFDFIFSFYFFGFEPEPEVPDEIEGRRRLSALALL